VILWGVSIRMGRPFCFGGQISAKEEGVALTSLRLAVTGILVYLSERLLIVASHNREHGGGKSRPL
jgi:hypothetical protein